MPHQGIFPMPPPANRLGAHNRFPPYIPGFGATLAGERKSRPLRDCAPIRLEATGFLQALRST